MSKHKYTPGFIYIATNPDIPFKIKIGFTTDVDSRMIGLSRATGVPSAFKAEWMKETPCIEIAEDVIHYMLREYRVSANKEFFEGISVKKAIEVSEYVIEVLFKANIVKPKFEEKHWQGILEEDRPAFVKKAIKLCLKEGRFGELGKHKRFGSIRTNYKGLDMISIYILKDYFRVNIHCNKINGKKILLGIFGKRFVRIEGWRDGYSVYIENAVDAENLFKWLELGKRIKKKQALVK